LEFKEINFIINFERILLENVFEEFLTSSLETQSWNAVSAEGTKPGFLYGHTATLYDDYMYIIGGRTSSASDKEPKCSSDIFIFNFGTLNFPGIFLL
jgi:hypothetical protein